MFKSHINHISVHPVDFKSSLLLITSNKYYEEVAPEIKSFNFVTYKLFFIYIFSIHSWFKSAGKTQNKGHRL